jgi:hypothetical protein
MTRHRIPAAIAVFISVFSASAAPPDWGSPPTAKNHSPIDRREVTTRGPQVDSHARWVRVAGCARDIAGGANGVIYVTGCDVVPNSRGSSAFYRWNGGAFAPLRVPGHGSAIATFGGNSYTIGGDAMLYTSINDGEWVKRGTPDNAPITDIGAGRGGIWIITSQPGDQGGNTIARAVRCPNAGIAGGAKDFCGWEDMPGAAVRISVGANIWVVNAQGHIFEWRSNGGGHWQKRPGCFTDVAANGHNVYAVGCQRGQGDGNKIFRWDNTGNWVDMQGAGKRVGVDAAGNAWVITDSGQIWRSEHQMAAGTPR